MFVGGSHTVGMSDRGGCYARYDWYWSSVGSYLEGTELLKGARTSRAGAPADVREDASTEKMSHCCVVKAKSSGRYPYWRGEWGSNGYCLAWALRGPMVNCKLLAVSS